MSWRALAMVSSQVFIGLRTIVMARVLDLGEVGVVGVALLVTSTIETLSLLGIRRALIQKRDRVDEYLDTAWTVGVVRGVILCAVLFLLSPWIAAFFEDPTLVPILQVVSVASVFKGLINIHVPMLQRSLEFKRLFRYDLSIVLVDAIASIILIVALRSAWGVIYGFLLGQLAGVVASYLVHPGRPRVEFDPSKFSELFRYGRWVSGTRFLDFLLLRLDRAVVGKVLGLHQLGYYQLAASSAAPSGTEIASLVRTTVFPAFAEAQSSGAQLKRGYLAVVKVMFLVTIPLTVFGIFFASDLVAVVLGSKWMPMVPAFQVLLVVGLLVSSNSAFISFMQAVGKPDVVAKSFVPQLVILVLLIVPLTHRFGLIGAALAVMSARVLSPVHLFVLIARRLRFSVSDLAQTFVTPVVAAGLPLALIGTLRTGGDPFQPAELGLWLSLSAILYILSVVALDAAFFGNSLRTIVHSVRGGRTGP